MEENIVSVVFDFLSLTKDDFNLYGIADVYYSPYSIKAVYMNEIVGYIVVEERNPNFVLNDSLNEDLYNRTVLLNNHKWLYIRKIRFHSGYLHSGNLENMFDKLISKIPNEYNLWCNISIKQMEKYIMQIGGFTDLPQEICPNRNIRIFNVYQRNNE